jgi:hypothetical protein
MVSGLMAKITIVGGEEQKVFAVILVLAHQRTKLIIMNKYS